MPRAILVIHDDKFNKDYYLTWSTIVDAPITYGLTREEYIEWYQTEYGNEGMVGLDKRLALAEAYGCNHHLQGYTLDDYLSSNRAGENEENIDKEGILDRYCRNHLA